MQIVVVSRYEPENCEHRGVWARSLVVRYKVQESEEMPTGEFGGNADGGYGWEIAEWRMNANGGMRLYGGRVQASEVTTWKFFLKRKSKRE